MSMPLARKIYWNLSLVLMAVLYAGQYRRHNTHELHGQLCKCMLQCLFCAIDSLRGK